MKRHPSVEYHLLSRLKPLLNYHPSKSYPSGIGDDTVLRRCAGTERLVFTADTFIENVHFRLDYMSLAEAGYKSMAAAVSDCAAAGSRPDGALVQVGVPAGGTGTVVELYRGFNRLCRRYDFPIVGGDLSRSPCWMIAITVIGRMERASRPLMRTGIRNGDVLWCTGRPGRSAAGLALLSKLGRKRAEAAGAGLVRSHLKPRPRIDAGLILSRCRAVHAAMDLSDGLSKDAATLCHDNGLGLVLEIDALVTADQRNAAARLRADPLSWVLHGGEDYELLFAAHRRFDPKAAGLDGCRRLGAFDRTLHGLSVHHGGEVVPVPAGSWDHLR